jgi:hypothetical protein
VGAAAWEEQLRHFRQKPWIGVETASIASALQLDPRRYSSEKQRGDPPAGPHDRAGDELADLTSSAPATRYRVGEGAPVSGIAYSDSRDKATWLPQPQRIRIA